MRRSLVLLALLGVTGAALASPPPAGGRPDAARFKMMQRHFEQQRMHRLTVLLDLTPAQQGKVGSILSEEHAKMRRSMWRLMKQARATHRAVRHQTLARLSSVLSPEQLKKFKLLMPGRMLIRRHGGPMGVQRFGAAGPAAH